MTQPRLTGAETVYDLYCGTGTIGLALASGAGSVWGVEISEEAVACAIENAEANGITNTSFFAGNVGQSIEELRERSGPPDVVVVDPPRAGLAGKALRRTGALEARRIVYVSCNPTTLASDLAVLRDEYGYSLAALHARRHVPAHARTSSRSRCWSASPPRRGASSIHGQRGRVPPFVGAYATRKEIDVTVRKLAVLGLGVLALAAAGCGGSDSSSEGAADETTLEATTAAEETTSVDDSTSTDAAGIGELSGECLDLAGVGAKVSEAFDAAGSGSGDLAATADAFDEFVAAAPDEIKDDLQVIAERFAEIAEALKGVDLTSGTPSAEDLQKLQEVGSSLDNAELKQASENIEAWVNENCKTG